MFNDDNTSIAAQPLFSSLHLLTKPSSSRKMYDFGLSSSSSEPVDEEIKIDDQAHKHIRDESESTPPNEDNTANATQAGPSEPPINQEEDKAKSRTSPSDIGSSTSNYVDLFALLELWDNVSDAVKKVESIETFVDGLDAKIDEKGFLSKLQARCNFKLLVRNQKSPDHQLLKGKHSSNNSFPSNSSIPSRRSKKSMMSLSIITSTPSLKSWRFLMIWSVLHKSSSNSPTSYMKNKSKDSRWRSGRNARWTW